MSEFRSIRVHAIVLRHADWGEADRFVTLYTREQGKLRAVAKGARKITSRKAGHLEPFTHVKLQLARGRDLFIVTQADTVDAYLPLRETLVLTGTASYVVELLDRFVYEEEGANPTLFRLLAIRSSACPLARISGWLSVIMKCACWISLVSGHNCSNAPTAGARSKLKTSSSRSQRAGLSVRAAGEGCQTWPPFQWKH